MITRGNQQWTQAFLYDGVDRLTCANEVTGLTALACGTGAPGWNQMYGYDTAGNRAVTSSSFPEDLSAPTNLNQYSSSTNRIGLQSNGQALPSDAYDAAGNLHNHPSMGTFSYDAENRMTGSTIGATATSYAYDGEGRRVSNTTAAGATYYVYDAMGELAAEYPAAMTTGGTQYLTVDALGSTRLVTNADGTVAEFEDYLPFGEQLAAGMNGRSAAQFNAADVVPEKKFTGKERDAETGLDFFGARYMSSAQGRFTSPDLVNVTDDRLFNPSNTLNKYIYGANNPLKYPDPDGRDITVFYEPGLPTGHVMLAASNPQNGDFALLSVGPQQHLDPGILSNPNSGVPGTPTFTIPQSVGELRQNFAALTIQTTPEIAQQAIDAIRNGAGQGNYSLTGNNCSSACAKVLKDIGLSPGSKGWFPWTPSKLWANLLRKYANDRNPVANAILAVTSMIQRVPQRGTDYGNPRYGQDTFSFVFQQEAIHPPTKACVTVQGPNGPETSCE